MTSFGRQQEIPKNVFFLMGKIRRLELLLEKNIGAAAQSVDGWPVELSVQYCGYQDWTEERGRCSDKAPPGAESPGTGDLSVAEKVKSLTSRLRKEPHEEKTKQKTKKNSLTGKKSLHLLP